MDFDEWHDKQNQPYENGHHCPHIEWERLAWNAALDAAAEIADEQGLMADTRLLGKHPANYTNDDLKDIGYAAAAENIEEKILALKETSDETK